MAKYPNVMRPRIAVPVFAFAILVLMVLVVVTLRSDGSVGRAVAASSLEARSASAAPSPSVDVIPAAPIERELSDQATRSRPAPLRKAPQVQAVVDGGSVRLAGTVPSAAVHRQLVAAVVDTYGKDAVVDDLEVDPAVGDQGVAQIGTVLTALGPDAAGVTVDLTDNTLAVDGFVSSDEVQEKVVAAAATVPADSSTVDETLRVLPPDDGQPPAASDSGSPDVVDPGPDPVDGPAAPVTSAP